MKELDMAVQIKRLKPKIGKFAMLCMAVGIIVGPWMPQMPFWFSLSGPSISLVFLVIMILAVPIILAYGELTAMLPFTGGAYNFARNAFGYAPAWIVGWFLILLYLIGTAFMGPATARMFQALFVFPDISKATVGMAGIGFLLIFSILNTFSINIAARIQLIMVLGMIIVGVATFSWFFGSGHWSLVNLAPFFTTGGKGFVVAVGIMLAMVIGFDCIPQMAEEANYSIRDMVWIMLAAVLISETFFALICFANAGMKPTSWIMQQVVVSPEIARSLGGNIPAAIMNIAGLLATLTSLNGFMIAAARVVFAMGRAKVLPPVFSRTNKYDQPHVAVWLVFVACSLMVILGGESWIETLFIAASFATGIVYTLTCLCAVVLRKKYPDWPRPYKMPGGAAMGVLATVIGTGITIAAAFGMPAKSWLLFCIWILAGLVVYAWMAIKRNSDGEYHETFVFTPADITGA
jgi:APA family basic amino acid/polyamine antiporter